MFRGQRFVKVLSFAWLAARLTFKIFLQRLYYIIVQPTLKVEWFVQDLYMDCNAQISSYNPCTNASYYYFLLSTGPWLACWL